jgi:RHS repeat-associated protein
MSMATWMPPARRTYNGSRTSVTLSGSTSQAVYDDEDRLVSLSVPGGPTDTFVYNGLGLRVGKTDSTGTYGYICDGTAPGSPVLTDGYAIYTPGLSENRSGTTGYYDFDRLGNLWTIDGTNKTQLYYQDTTGFGTLTALGGTVATPFKFGGGNGCQTDGDFGLVLMGHRYYDTRTGRFISQDPKGDGTNWYTYAGNDPVNKTDPSGLSIIFAPRPGDGAGGLGPDAGGLFGGENTLDSFFSSQDAAIQQWQDENQKSAAEDATQAASDSDMNGMGGGFSQTSKGHVGHTETIDDLDKKLTDLN